MVLVNTIKKRSDFKKVTQEGIKVVCRPFILFLRKSKEDKDSVQVGFIVSSKVGNAVDRNRIKRRLRSLSYTTLSNLPYKGYSICFLAKRQAYFVDFEKMREDLIASIKKSL